MSELFKDEKEIIAGTTRSQMRQLREGGAIPQRSTAFEEVVEMEELDPDIFTAEESSEESRE